MKKIFNISIIIFLLLLSSCEDFLDEQNKSNATAENLYVTQTGYESLINACYATLRDVYRPIPYLFSAGTDEFYGGHTDAPLGITTYISLTPGEPRVAAFFQVLYESIQLCNTAIYYADLTVSFTALQSRLGEVMYLRAYYYFLLVQHFGDISLVEDMITTPVTHFERTPASEVYEFIISELMTAIERLPALQSDYGRVTKRAARHLLAKVYLTRGYEDFGIASDFTNAASYAEQAIENNPLSVGFKQIFAYQNDRNPEIIFAVQYDANSVVFGGPHSWDLPWGPLIGGFGTEQKRRLLRPTEYLFTIYGANDLRFDGTFGMVRTQSYVDLTLNPNNSRISHYFPRTAQEIAGVAAWRAISPEFRNATQVIPIGSAWWDPTRLTYPALDKFDRLHTTAVQYVKDLFLSRLGETYLIAAEAYLKSGNLAAAAEKTNVVRLRAAKPGFEEDMMISPGDLSIDFILDERTRELAGEGHRWTDLKRTGKLMERTRKYNPDIKAYYDSGQDPFLGSNGHYKVLRPIPLMVISLDTGDYPQNPAYD